MTLSLFKDFPGLENLEKKSRTFKDRQIILQINILLHSKQNVIAVSDKVVPLRFKYVKKLCQQLFIALHTATHHTQERVIRVFSSSPQCFPDNFGIPRLFQVLRKHSQHAHLLFTVVNIDVAFKAVVSTQLKLPLYTFVRLHTFLYLAETEVRRVQFLRLRTTRCFILHTRQHMTNKNLGPDFRKIL